MNVLSNKIQSENTTDFSVCQKIKNKKKESQVLYQNTLNRACPTRVLLLHWIIRRL